MLAGSDISEEAFSHHLRLGTGLPAGSPVLLCSSSIWTGVAGCPGWGTQKKMIATLEPSSFILLSHYSSPTLCIYGNPPVPCPSFTQPCRSTKSSGCSGEVVTTPALLGSDPSHRLPWALHPHTACQCLPLPGCCPLFGQMSHMRDHKWTYLSAFISPRRYRSRDSSELQRGHRRCCRKLAGCLSGSASSRQIASEVCWKLLSTFQVSDDSHWQFC